VGFFVRRWCRESTKLAASSLAVSRNSARSNIRLTQPLAWSKKTSEETMAEKKQDPLDVPMNKVITKTDDSGNDGSAPKTKSGPTAATDTHKIEGSHTQETIDPAERLPDEPKG
jgi:hypothetical protein